MNILVTGATGFVGKRLVSSLLDHSHKVVIIKHLQDTSVLDPRIVPHTLTYTDVDADIAFLREQRISGVVHLASLFLASHSSADVKNLVESNVLLGTYLLECAFQAGISWFVNTGTFWQNYKNAAYCPVNLYAATKQAFQSMAEFYIGTGRIRFASLKLCDTYGPGDTRQKVMNLFDRISRTGEVLEMSGGEQVLDLSYIDDIVDAFVRLIALMNDDAVPTGSVFAVKAARRLTLKELASVFENVSNRKLNIRWGARPYREREVMVPWEDGMPVPGWIPRVSLEDGIRRMIGTK